MIADYNGQDIRLGKMIYDPDKHHRRSICLQGCDYARAGAYFVTICTRDRDYLLGEIVNGEMHLNAAGEIVQDEWLRWGRIREEIELDRFVVMPNHLHGVALRQGLSAPLAGSSNPLSPDVSMP